MGSESRGHTASLKDQLFSQPQRFDFFQAVRLLKGFRSNGAVGGDDPDDEVVRFRSDVSLAFPTADISALEPFGEQERAAVVWVAFMGLASPSSFGSLPTPYAEEIRRQDAAKEPALHEFLDLFNHRFTSFFYRAWEKYRLALEAEVRGQQFFERALFGVIGLGTPGLRGRLSLEDHALLARGGLLAMSPVPASAIEQVVESYFGVPVRVRQFVPAWYAIERDDRTRLGSANSRLGEDAVLGESVQLAQSKFEVQLGPLAWEQYQDFFPTAGGFAALVDLVQLMLTTELDFQCRPVLRRQEVPPFRLEHQPSQACRLGWSTWLGTEPHDDDADDAILAGLRPPGAPTLESMEVAP